MIKKKTKLKILLLLLTFALYSNLYAEIIIPDRPDRGSFQIFGPEGFYNFEKYHLVRSDYDTNFFVSDKAGETDKEKIKSTFINKPKPTTIDCVELSINVEQLKGTKNYVKVNYVLKNKNKSDKVVSVLTQAGPILGNDNYPHIHNKINGKIFEGIWLTNEDPDAPLKYCSEAHYVFRNNKNVTDVDNYYFSKKSCGPLDWWTQSEDIELEHAWKPCLYYGWKDRVLKPNETKVFSILIGCARKGQLTDLAQKKDPTISITQDKECRYEYYLGEEFSSKGVLNIVDGDDNDTYRLRCRVNSGVENDILTDIKTKDGKYESNYSIKLSSIFEFVSGYGERNVSFWIEDKDKNKSNMEQIKITMLQDTTPPKVTYEMIPNRYTNKDVLVKFTLEDKETGLKYLVRPDTGTLIHFKGEKILDFEYLFRKNNNYNLKFVNKANLETEVKVDINTIDKDRPTINTLILR